MVVSTVRIGLVILTTAVFTAGLCGAAAAHHGKRHWRAHRSRSEGRCVGRDAQLASQQPVRLGPMRYYGGPKSPMWREVR